MADASSFVETAHPRAVDGTFAAKQRDEAGDVDLSGLSVPDYAREWNPRDSTTWGFSHFPDQVVFEDLGELIENYDTSHTSSWHDVEGRTCTLVHNFDFSGFAAANDPVFYASETYYDEEPGEESQEYLDLVDDYECLAENMKNRPWNAPPLVLLDYGIDLDSGEHMWEIADGSHRTGLAMHVGVTTHPAYVIDMTERSHRSRPASEMMADYAPTDGLDWGSLRAEYEAEHPVVMAALREDMSTHGMKTPVVVRDGRIENGQHRILVAADLGIEVTWREWTPADSGPSAKRYWDPMTREHYGPDEDEDDEGQPRY